MRRGLCATHCSVYALVLARARGGGRGGAICLSIHFMPLWAKNVPRFGIAHALALGVRA